MVVPLGAWRRSLFPDALRVETCRVFFGFAQVCKEVSIPILVWTHRGKPCPEGGALQRCRVDLHHRPVVLEHHRHAGVMPMPLSVTSSTTCWPSRAARNALIVVVQ